MLDYGRTLTLLPALLLAVGCSDDSSKTIDAAVSWPDLGADQTITPDASPPDAAVPDTLRPDTLRPDTAPPTSSWKLTRPTTANLNAVACGKSHVFAAGANGTMLHAGPSSSTFTKQKVPTTVELLTVTFASDTTGMVAHTAGRSSDIWESKDWGKTWTTANQCSAYTFKAFHSLHLVSTSEGFGCGEATGTLGGGIKYWAGYSWVCISPSYPKKVFYDAFRLGMQGWVVGDTGGTIYRTADQGTSWNPVITMAGVPLRGVHFASAKLGVVVGDKGAVLRSADGKGQLWGVINVPTTENLTDVFFADTKNGWAVGAKGTVLHTADGGNTWKVQPTPTTDGLTGVCFASVTEGWAVGKNGAVLHTTRGGK